MTLKERLQAEYQNEIEKMAQAEELLNFQVRCLYKAAEIEGVAHELSDLADEDVIKLAQEMDYEGTFDGFREDPSLLFTEEEIKLAQDAEHADLMGRYMARSFAEETRKLAYAEEVGSDPDVAYAYDQVFGKEARRYRGVGKGHKFVVDKAKMVKEHIRPMFAKIRASAKGGGPKQLGGKVDPKADLSAYEKAEARGKLLRRAGQAAVGAGLVGAGAVGAKMMSGKGKEKKAAAEFEIEAVKVASDLMEFAQYELPQGADLTLEKAASMVTAAEYPVLERAWEILGEQGILA